MKELSLAFNLHEPHIWIITMSKLGLTRSTLDAAILRFSRDLRDGSCDVRELAEDRIHELSGEISQETAEDCEAAVPSSEHELALRILLLCYYFHNRRESEHTTKARQHILWIIQFAPESKIAGRPYSWLIEPDDQEAYVTAKTLWLKQVSSRPSNTRILGNAARFFCLMDWEISEDLLRRASTLEPNNHKWHDQLATLYSLHSRDESSTSLIRREQAFREHQIAAQLEFALDDEGNGDDQTFRRILRLIDLAKSAFDSKHFEEADQYATELMERIAPFDAAEHTFPIGNAIHHGNIVLGRLALQNGDVNLAKDYLLAAGRTPGSPQLDSFGPNMALAKELLERNEQIVVFEYFEFCQKFWELHSGRLEKWANEINAGNIPDFGPHLVY